MVRTRFAPSPTGFLHIGSARTALFCWLYARKLNGKFILRVEDTDLERSTPESVQAILDAMQWLNLDYDEGPIFQSHRFDRYKEVINQLLAEKKAYRCYCSKERLEKLRTEQTERKEKPRYDGFCRERKDHATGAYVVRFLNPSDGVIEFNDLIRGKLTFSNAELDDLIIARTDGTPTYNFTVVVDDADMAITHVIRGDDHINNTPRQINILRALGVTPPLYAHVPMILGSDGKRLSKRHGAAGVMEYRDQGFLPHALLNYLVRLGWSHGDQEIFSVDEMIKFFEIKDINRAPAALNPDKLLWLNQHYIKALGPEVVKEFAWHLKVLNIDVNNGPPIVNVIASQAERIKNLREMAERSRFFYQDVKISADLKTHFPSELKLPLSDLVQELSHVSNWTKSNLHEVLHRVAEKHGLKIGKLAQPVRVAVTGGAVSPPIDLTLELLGKDRAIERINRVLAD